MKPRGEPLPSTGLSTAVVDAPWLDDLADALDAMEAINGYPRTRWPRHRTGSRDEIPPRVRSLTYLRDNHRCRRCGWLWQLTLDHIVPWSAGGTDDSANLITLCSGCNSSRSNFRETWLPRVVPVTELCEPCFFTDQPDYDPGDRRIVAFCGRCTATSWVSDAAYLL